MASSSETPVAEELASAFRGAKLVWALRAIAALVIGVLVLVWPQSTVSILAVLLGIYFVVLGILRVIAGITDKDLNGGGRVANLIIGALVLAGGVIVIRNPFETAVFVVLLIGVSWIFEGIATLVDTARGHGDGVSIVIGILIAIAGVLIILFADGVAIGYAIFFGVTLIVVGILDLVLLFRVGSAVKQATA
jgi:uncharacterized membrane protein HdeD (DUF308 family)